MYINLSLCLFPLAATENVFKTFVRVLKTTHTRRAVVVGCGLQAIQQLCGINTVMYVILLP